MSVTSEIALLGSSFRNTQEEATLHGRVAFARIVLRLERVALLLRLNTSAGEREADGRYVHKFRAVARDAQGERPRDYRDENVFDIDPGDDAEHSKPPRASTRRQRPATQGAIAAAHSPPSRPAARRQSARKTTTWPSPDGQVVVHTSTRVQLSC